MSYFQILQLAAPETIVVVTALAVLALDLMGMRSQSLGARFGLGAAVASLGCVLAILFALGRHEHANLFNGMLVVDSLTNVVKAAILVLTIFTAVLSTSSKFTEHVGEYLALILLATVGMMFLVSAEDLLMIFISLELLSLSLYVLTAFNKRNIKSAEAALKYFLFGGMSAAMMLFGLSLIYGLSGALKLARISAQLQGPALDPLLVVAIVMVLAGLGFKIAAYPLTLLSASARAMRDALDVLGGEGVQPGQVGRQLGLRVLTVALVGGEGIGGVVDGRVLEEEESREIALDRGERLADGVFGRGIGDQDHRHRARREDTPHVVPGREVTGEPAGAFVAELRGSYTGVMGLPLYETVQLLRTFIDE